MEKVGNIKAIKDFFQAGDGHKVEIRELKALSQEERLELAALAAAELGVELLPPK